MLGKLIKHEFKVTSRWFLPIYLLVLLLAPIERITVSMLDSGMARQLDEPWKQIAAIVFFIVSLAYALSLMAAGFSSILLIIYRFHKNLTTNEGYLMHTLPVKTSELIWSKAITGMIWTVISGFVIILALLILLVNNTDGFLEFLQAFRFSFDNFYELYGFEMNWFLLILELLTGAIVGSLQHIFMIYAAIAIGQLFNQHKVLFSFLAYFGLDLALNFITNLIAIPAFHFVDLPSLDRLAELLTTTYLPLALAGSAFVAGVFYFITWYIFKNRLNLE